MAINDIILNVIIVRKKNKNIYFRFDDKLNLVVTASKWVSQKEIENLIEKNSKSLLKMREKCLNKIAKNKDFYYLGQKYELQYTNSEDIEFDNGVLKIKDEATLNKFINQKIKEIFSREVANINQIIETPKFTLRFRKMKSRWGVCNYVKKTVTLNTELIKYNLECLRYVIVHELCHFYHHNHSQSFWDMVAIYCPNYKEIRKELK